MKKNTLQNALPIVAAAYGEKFGVKVSIGTDLAYTNGKEIVVPNAPEDYPHKDVIWGYLAHEAAHVRFTDFTVVRRKGLHAELSNIIEDCRIERAIQAIYPGTVKTINEVARYMAQAGHYQHVRDKEPPAAILSGFCLYWLQTKVVGQSILQPYLDTATTVFEQVFPQGVATGINTLLRKAVDIRSTADATSLADEIIQMIEEEKEEQKPELSQSQANSNQSKDSQAESSSGNRQESQSHTDSVDKHNGESEQGKPQDNQNGQAEVDSQQENNHQQSQDTQGGQDQAGAAELLAQVLKAGASELRGDAHSSLKSELSQVAQESGDTHIRTVPQAIEVKGEPDIGKNLLAEVRSATAKIRARLYGLVQASQRVTAHSKRAGKRLDTRNLHRVLVGDTRVFLSAMEKKCPNTAVHLLVDMSTSMKVYAENGEFRQEIARKASLAVAIALEAIPGVNPAVTFFAGNEKNPVFSILKHGEKPQRQAAKFAFNARGYTPMTEAIWYGAFELGKTREARKMLIIITDGAPDDLSSCRSVISLCERSEVEVCGVGIEMDLSHLFQKNITIDEVSSLQSALFGLMQQSLTTTAA